MTTVAHQPGVSAAEAAAARFDAENVFRLPGGGTVIADSYREPMQSIETCLVEYASADLVGSPDGAARLVDFARREFPAARMLLVRLAEYETDLAGFEDYLLYLLLTGAPIAHADETTVRVRSAGPQDAEFVSEFLVEAFDDGLEMRLEKAPAGAAIRQTRAVLANPAARSFVVSHDGTDIGHATLLIDQEDDLTGLRYVELLDLLVERKHPHRYSAESKLVTASWQAAQSMGRPLLSHIVVREKTCHCAGVELMILDRLKARGWVFHHKYQRFMLDG
jgi:hypothetical protein